MLETTKNSTYAHEGYDKQYDWNDLSSLQDNNNKDHDNVNRHVNDTTLYYCSYWSVGGLNPI